MATSSFAIRLASPGTVAPRSPGEAYLLAPHPRSGVRLGLVVVGLAFVVVGAGLVVTFFVFSSGAPPGGLTRSISAVQMSPNSTQVWTLATIATGHGTLALTWSSTGPASVALARAADCPSSSGLCPVSPALVVWEANSSGFWRTSGGVSSTYFLTATGRSSNSINLNATLSESYPGTAFGLASPELILLTVGCVLLLGTGAVGVFLGLFLAGGVYQPPPAPRRRIEIYSDLEDEPGDFEEEPLEPPE